MVSRQETARPLLTPGEVMQLPPDDELVLVSGVPADPRQEGAVLRGSASDRARAAAADARKQPSRESGADGRLERNCPLRRGAAGAEPAASVETVDDLSMIPQMPAFGASRSFPSMRRSRRSTPSHRPEFDFAEDEADDDAVRARVLRRTGSRSRAPGGDGSRRRHRALGARSMRTKHTFRLPPDLAGQLADYAGRKRVPQALVVETALASFLSPDDSERMEAALGRRLDRLDPAGRAAGTPRHHLERSAGAVRALLADRDAATAGYGAAGRAGQGPASATKALSRRSAGDWRRARPWPQEISQDVDAEVTAPERSADRFLVRARSAVHLSLLRQSTTTDLMLVARSHVLPFLIDPRSEPHVAVAATGDDVAVHSPPIRGDLARRAHAAHRARARRSRLARRPVDRRGDAQPRRAALDRPAVGRAWPIPANVCRRADGERIVRLVAHHVGAEVHPAVAARLGRAARDGRAVRGPAAAGRRGAGLRDPQARRRRLHARRLCRRRHHDGAPGRALRAAVAERRNILVAGGTSTGKTTLTNALLAEVAKTSDRVVLIEDTRELQCARRTSSRCGPRTASPRSPISSAPRCACAPIASRSVRCAAPRRSTS